MTENQNRGHLTVKDISQYLVEGPTIEADHHLRICGSCQAKLAEATGPLTAFRTALVAWSEDQNQVRRIDGTTRKARSHWTSNLWLPAASLTLAALLLVGFFTGSKVFPAHPVERQAAVTSTSPDSDTALMNQVDAEVSEAVPDAMAPLTDLVAWDSSETASNPNPEQHLHSPKKKSTVAADRKAPVHAED